MEPPQIYKDIYEALEGKTPPVHTKDFVQRLSYSKQDMEDALHHLVFVEYALKGDPMYGITGIRKPLSEIKSFSGHLPPPPVLTPYM